MADFKGRFVWYELMSNDLAAARAFYGQVVGWGATDSQMPNMTYWLFTQGEEQVAGLMDIPPEARAMGAPPSWLGYIAVDDVDAASAAVAAAGGSVLHPTTEIPNMLRFTVVADPGGAVFGLLQGLDPNPPQELPSQEAPGRVGWHELYAGDGAAAFDFYSRVFGWEKKDTMDMGEMGVYQMFGLGDVTLGGMMTKPPEMPMAVWGYYFNVGSVEQAAERVRAAGGQVIQGPMEVPGGQFILQGVDPQGAHFALVGSR